ncbi:MAG: hypothetical protein AABX30_00645 [Nanoarchaeota archaeon]
MVRHIFDLRDLDDRKLEYNASEKFIKSGLRPIGSFEDDCYKYQAYFEEGLFLGINSNAIAVVHGNDISSILKGLEQITKKTGVKFH